MTLIRPRLDMVLVLAVFHILEGCSRCGCGETSEHLAELVETQGQIQRDCADRLEQWKSASPGTVFEVGDGVRAKARSEAVLKLSEGSYARLKANSMIRFLQTMPGSRAKGIDIQQGEAEIEVGTESLQLQSSVGSAVIKSGSKIRISKSDKGLDFYVAIGTATFQTKGDQSTVVGAGESIRIGIGSAVLAHSKHPREQEQALKENQQTGEPTLEQSAQPSVSVEVKGSGVRVRRSKDAPWESLSPGFSELAPNTVLAMPKNTSIMLRRKQDKATIYGAGTYRIGGPDQTLVHALSGKVIFESSDRNVAVVVPGGVIIANGGEPGGTRASVDVNNENTLVKVQTGRIQVERPGQTQSLLAGQETTIVNPGATGSVGMHPSSIDEGPAFADLSVKAGESFIVHSTKPPVAVAFELAGRCPHGAIAQLIGRRVRSRGTTIARLLFEAGRSRYFIRCLNADGTVQPKTAASGAVTVLRDPGTAGLPRKAPESRVEADGRNYNILYQNQLPIVKLRWPAAPKAGSCILNVLSQAAGNREYPCVNGEYTFESGGLRDGTHRFSFRTGDSRRSSKTTTVRIRFDNAAPKVSLREPKEGQFRVGESVTVTGVAVPGWAVSLANGTIATDEYNRFSGKVTYGDQYRSIALRVVHPQRGIHYYLRRGQNQAP
ncbi:MAG: hypothetical protein JXA30_17695 [Deltaproteobacteria bacterium]|nr:hypothetical protein [Deltaproteobacteria bacterium]